MQAALLTGLRARRRPAGYWESDENLGRELTAFVLAGAWAALPSDGGAVYHHNPVGGKGGAGERGCTRVGGGGRLSGA